MTMPLTDSIVEGAAIAWLETFGYAVLYGPKIDPGILSAIIPILSLMPATHFQNKTLYALHYTLTPKLNSGEVRVSFPTTRLEAVS